MGRKALDLTGASKGAIEVFRLVEKDSREPRYDKYEIKCHNCGKVQIVRRRYITRNGRTRCGCEGKEKALAKFTDRWTDPSTARDRAEIAFLDKYQRKPGWELSRQEALEIGRSNCIYCGSEPSNEQAFVRVSQGKKHRIKCGEKFNGIDRIDSSIGYRKSNVVPCCIQCNKAKLDYPLKDFLSWVSRVHKTISTTEFIKAMLKGRTKHAT